MAAAVCRNAVDAVVPKLKPVGVILPISVPVVVLYVPFFQLIIAWVAEELRLPIFTITPLLEPAAGSAVISIFLLLKQE